MLSFCQTWHDSAVDVRSHLANALPVGGRHRDVLQMIVPGTNIGSLASSFYNPGMSAGGVLQHRECLPKGHCRDCPPDLTICDLVSLPRETCSDMMLDIYRQILHEIVHACQQRRPQDLASGNILAQTVRCYP